MRGWQMNLKDCFKKYGAYIKAGIIILIVGGVIAYVYKKNLLSATVDGNDAGRIAESGIRELRATAGRIRDRDRQSAEIIVRTAERNRRLSESIGRAEAGVIRSQERTDRITEIARRAEDRNREITELSDRARDILSKLRENI